LRIFCIWVPTSTSEGIFRFWVTTSVITSEGLVICLWAPTFTSEGLVICLWAEPSPPPTPQEPKRGVSDLPLTPSPPSISEGLVIGHLPQTLDILQTWARDKAIWVMLRPELESQSENSFY
jgi:hypothetical protein